MGKLPPDTEASYISRNHTGALHQRTSTMAAWIRNEVGTLICMGTAQKFMELCRFSGSYIGVQGAVQVSRELHRCSGSCAGFQGAT